MTLGTLGAKFPIPVIVARPRVLQEPDSTASHRPCFFGFFLADNLGPYRCVISGPAFFRRTIASTL
jgi:hypothetical protein